MKRLFILHLLLILSCATLLAQKPDFDLFFANNVTDVTNFEEIKNPDSGLKWRKVQTVEGDFAGNYVEVAEVHEMLGSTRKKWLADQRQFWTMRDHTLLCFRIDDLANELGNFEVSLNNGHDEFVSLTANDYFFANLPLQEEPYEIKVSRVSNPEMYYKFRYFINDWDNENLYIFQLDQKRQATGKNYMLECITGSIDEEGDLHTKSTLLELQAKSFQSLYVPEGEDLIDVLLLDDGNKLRIDKNKLHRGIDLNDAFRYMDLTNDFHLDKHENREMMNFNWIGSGLYEKYDTLFLSLWNEKSRPLPSATIHVESVDAEGNPIRNIGAKYLGYDAKSKTHKVLTMGQPAYIEVISRGYLPMVYKYKGPVDPETGIVSEALCAADLTLRQGTVSANSLTVSDQHFLNLHDEKTVIVRNGVDHVLCSIDPVDLSIWLPADTVTYMEDCGQEYPKLLNNTPVERYAKLQVSFSRPKGSGLPDSRLYCTDISTNIEREATQKELKVIGSDTYPSFSYDYYFVDFDLLDVISRNSTCKLELKSQDLSYKDFPFLRNLVFDRDEKKKDAEEEINDEWVGGSSRNNYADAFGDCGWDMKLPFNFKTSFDPVALAIAFTYDFRKNLFNLLINVSFNRDNTGESEKFSKAREEKKAYDSFMAIKSEDGKSMLQIPGDDVAMKDWLYKDIADIFDVNNKRIGKGWFGSAKFNFKIGDSDWSHFQVSEVSGQIGYGVGMFWGNLAENPKFEKLKPVLKKVEKYVSFSGCAELSAQVDFGIKSFDSDAASSMSSMNMGYFARFSAKASAGATLQISTPESLSKVFFANAGLRFGGKLGFQAGLEGPFDSYKPGVGARIVALVVGQAFLNIKTFLFSWSGSAQFQLGDQFLLPNNDHNPFHADFPYWLPKKKIKPMAESYMKAKAPEASDYGRAVAENVAIDANPHFLDGNTIVYNDLKSPLDYNDDQVTLLDLNEGTTKKLSSDGTTATSHMRSKRANHEIVVYEQMNRTVDNDNVTSDNALSLSVGMQSHIQAKVRNSGGDWVHTNVTLPNTDGTTDMKPVVTIQEDGHAACIYEHGILCAADEDESMDSITNIVFVGQLMLKTFDGTKWSDPTPLYFDLDKDNVINQYDLFMRNDTVLVAANLRTSDMDHNVLRYASKPIASAKVSYNNDSVIPNQFMMQRVGQHAIIAIVYQATDSVPDIYLRALDMSGQFDNSRSASLNTGYKIPNKVKIVCDRNAQKMDDFAVLWTELNNVYRGDDGTESYTENICNMLNASRVHISNTLHLTDPITVGGEQDSVLVMTDFDGFLDDAHICAVYTLGDPLTGAAVIMANDKYFRNSCETKVSYGNAALLNGGSLPVDVYVRNTGTSPVMSVQAVINGQVFDIENAYVAPAKDKTFTVLYPIDEDFDGYITSSVHVQYNNIFKIKAHPRRKAMNYLRQTFMMQRKRITSSDVECNIVSRSIEDGANQFIVELIDHGNLPSDMGVRVGIYGHPSSAEPLTDEADVLVPSTDFILNGNTRKAYATVNIRGITEPLKAYVNCHVVDMNYDTQDLSVSHVKNRHGIFNAALVNLFPTDDPVAIKRPNIDEALTSHRIQLTVLEDGISLSNVTPNETVRILTADGFTVGKNTSTSTTLFFPLTQKGVYILTSGEESFKFKL